MLHTVDRAIFEAQLRFLRDNCYQVLDAEELYLFLQRRIQLRGPGVVLTFDDGEHSLYHTAFPLLKKYGFKAVAFLVPSRILDSRNTTTQGKQWLTWAEVREMQASGVVDMQSHTMHHERIFTSPRVLDFLRPGMLDDDLKLDMPTVGDEQDGQLQIRELGMPIYAFGSRMDDDPRYFDSVRRRRACVQHVKNHGGELFFQRPGWKCELYRVWEGAETEKGERYESNFEQRNAIFSSLKASRTVLEERLQKPVRHVAFPWCIAGRVARELSWEAGYVTNFLGPLPGVPLACPEIDPFSIPRLKDDYLFRLPGKGRHSLASVFAHKLVRRMTKREIY
ncbi:polysaccharide deacetylase family protein [Desulfonatronum sp. SC1]|uniref:polysaccharide deacetylase family protein n=1 Tax=Desulfonatronum sp. SC1 TaxID=2109626 RepID=UPI001304C511|nr:polysaccharide deacetylase family protein [Desulfonatronum sp. SC1]